jgi:phosphatidylglycerol lysyltransferase
MAVPWPAREAHSSSAHVVAALRLALFAVACVLLWRQIDAIRPGEGAGAFQKYGVSHIPMAFLGTAGSFVALGCIELAALRHCSNDGADIPVPKSAALGVSFVANALSQSAGSAILTGSAVRHRAYTRFGLGSADVLRATGIVTLSTTLGLLAAGATALLLRGAPARIRDRAVDLRALGASCALPVLAYLAWSLFGGRQSIGRGRWRVPRPAFAVTALQVSLGAADWLLTGAVLVALLPGALGVGFWSLLQGYPIAQPVSMVSHVPAGAGVLELALFALLSSAAPPQAHGARVAALVMFRLVYYVVPLGIAIVVSAVSEMVRPARLASAISGTSHAR